MPRSFCFNLVSPLGKRIEQHLRKFHWPRQTMANRHGWYPTRPEPRTLALLRFIPIDWQKFPFFLSARKTNEECLTGPCIPSFDPLNYRTHWLGAFTVTASALDIYISQLFFWIITSGNHRWRRKHGWKYFWFFSSGNINRSLLFFKERRKWTFFFFAEI